MEDIKEYYYKTILPHLLMDLQEPLRHHNGWSAEWYATHMNSTDIEYIVNKLRKKFGGKYDVEYNNRDQAFILRRKQ